VALPEAHHLAEDDCLDPGAAQRTCDGKPLRPRSDNYYLSHVVSFEFYELSKRTLARS
jgi:hypothetical protein